MPELPEVENVARGLRRLEGSTLRQFDIFDGRVWFESEVGPEAFHGKKLIQVTRRGKYLLFRFSGGLSLLQHLRMTGKMLELASPAIPANILREMGTNGPKARQIRCRFVFSGSTVVFYDTRRFGTLTAVPNEEEYFSRKGIAPDPFGQEEEARAHFLLRIRGIHRPIKAALLDQALIAGVGNIYADEALFATGTDPRTIASRVKDAGALWEAIRKILAESMEVGGSSIVNYVGADGKPGQFGEQLKVYGRGGEPCSLCSRPIKRIQLGGRSTHFCSSCQKKR